jgi:uncharacterized protein (UPF0371 family)
LASTTGGTFTRGYPTKVDQVVSEEGYGANGFIHTERPIVVVAGPGPGSGKLATSLSQLYHEHRLGNNAGYAKFETFPIWNLPLKHLSRIPDEIHLLTPNVMESIASLKKDIMRMKAVSLDLDETLIALAISATTNPSAMVAMERLKNLAGCEFHTTHIPSAGDEAGLRRLGVYVTSEPNFATRSLVIS